MLSKKTLVFISLTMVLLFTAGSASAYWIWTPQTKRWINPKYAPKESPEEQLTYALDFFQAKDYKKALSEFRKLIKYYKRSEAASEAQYYVGRCYEELQNPVAAHKAYQEVVNTYPFTQRTNEIVDREFNIAERLYEGEKTKFLGMSFKALPEQIVEIYRSVVTNAPYSENAPKAQMRIGELNKKIGFYEEAREAYQKVIEDYPDSPLASDAKFQVAVCAAAAAGKPGYDQEMAAEATKEFEEFAKEHPDSELVKKAQEERKSLMEKQAQSYIKIATFYERLGKYQSAYIYYKKILDEFPDVSAAPKALERLKVMEKRLQKKK